MSNEVIRYIMLLCNGWTRQSALLQEHGHSHNARWFYGGPLNSPVADLPLSFFSLS